MIAAESLAAAARLSRQADLFLASVCAEHLVDGPRAAALLVIRPGAVAIASLIGHRKLRKLYHLAAVLPPAIQRRSTMSVARDLGKGVP